MEEVASLADLIMDAYHVKRYQLSGLPAWGDSGHDLYDISATAAGEHPPTVDQVRKMLQALLADRFQLKLHRETRELRFLALVVAAHGPKLTRVVQEDGKPPAACSPGRGTDGTPPFFRSWDRIPEFLSKLAGPPVIDNTGLDGIYCTNDGQDPELAVLLGGAGPAKPGTISAVDGNSIFAAIEEKWGLKLEPKKGSVDMLVIDHVERPSGN